MIVYITIISGHTFCRYCYHTVMYITWVTKITEVSHVKNGPAGPCHFSQSLPLYAVDIYITP